MVSTGHDGLSKCCVGFDEELVAGLRLHECIAPAKNIIERLKTDLAETSEKFKVYTTHGNTSVPLMRLKFGKLFFHDRFDMRKTTSITRKHYRSFIDCSTKYTSESLEENFQRSSFSKVFDNSLTNEEYRQLHEFVNLDAERTWSKEK